MPRLSTRLALTSLTACAAAAIGAGYAVNYAQSRHDLQNRASTITGGGDAQRGEALVSAYGCGGCHSINGVPQASGKVGPPLTGIGSRVYLAGRLENRPENLIRWILDPRAIDPGTAMPPLGLSPRDARDVAAFLYTLS
jgi:cytochrome c2